MLAHIHECCTISLPLTPPLHCFPPPRLIPPQGHSHPSVALQYIYVYTDPRTPLWRCSIYIYVCVCMYVCTDPRTPLWRCSIYVYIYMFLSASPCECQCQCQSQSQSFKVPSITAPPPPLSHTHAVAVLVLVVVVVVVVVAHTRTFYAENPCQCRFAYMRSNLLFCRVLLWERQ